MAHAFYLLGIAIGTTFTLENVYTSNFIIIDKMIIAQSVGNAVIISSASIITLCAINEILNKIGAYNYKMSLDHNVQYENANQQIFLNKIFSVTKKPNDEKSINISGNQNQKLNKSFITGTIIFAVYSRVLSYFYFYYPIIYINYAISTQISSYMDMNFYVIHWIAFAGALFSVILYVKMQFRMNILIQCGLAIAVLSLLWIFISFYFIPYANSLKYLYWTVYMVCGICISISDIICLEIVPLKYTEITLAAGYGLELIITGTIQFGLINNFKMFMCTYCTGSKLISRHAGIFIVLICVLGICTKYIIPRDMANQSLLESMNLINKSSIRINKSSGISQVSSRAVESTQYCEYIAQIELFPPPSYQKHIRCQDSHYHIYSNDDLTKMKSQQQY